MKANSFDSPGRVGGNTEDIDPILSILEPQETPFTSGIKKGRTSATDPDFGVDSLRKPRITGTREGEPGKGGNNKAKGRKRFKGQVHRWFDEWAVTDVQEAVAKAGGNAFVDSEVGKSKADSILEHKRDIEATCLSNQEMVKGADKEMQTRGLFKWIQNAAQAIEPVPEEFRTPNSSILSGVGTGSSVFTEEQFQTLLKSVKRVYGTKVMLDLHAGNDVISTIDNFTRIDPGGNQRYTVTQDASDHKIELSVTIYDCSFARVAVISNEFIRWNTALEDSEPNAGALIKSDLWELKYLEAMTQETTVDTKGAGPSGNIKSMGALGCRNPKGHAVIYGS